MLELYPEIRWVHVGAVIASGFLFMVRGLAVNSGARWPMAAPTRYLSYGIDTVLLVSALTLITILQQYPFVQSWLTVKVVLLTVYIMLGTFALKRGRTRSVRIACYLAALLTYGFIISVARAHHPLGFIHWLR